METLKEFSELCGFELIPYQERILQDISNHMPDKLVIIDQFVFGRLAMIEDSIRWRKCVAELIHAKEPSDEL